MAPERAEAVILACCVLHNYLRMEDTQGYTPPGFTDSVDPEGTIIDGSWRQADAGLLHVPRTSQRNPSASATDVRQQFIQYLSNAGRLEWQERHVNRI